MAISKALDVSPMYLMDGEEPNVEFVPHIQAPLFASVSAGLGSTREEAIGTYPCVVSNKEEAENTFCVIVSGDSMSPEINDGDIIQVRRQTSVDSGDIAIIVVDDTDYFVKKVDYGVDYIRLISLNKDYEPIIFKDAEVLRCDVRGKVIGSFKRW